MPKAYNKMCSVGPVLQQRGKALRSMAMAPFAAQPKPMFE